VSPQHPKDTINGVKDTRYRAVAYVSTYTTSSEVTIAADMARADGFGLRRIAQTTIPK